MGVLLSKQPTCERASFTEELFLSCIFISNTVETSHFEVDTLHKEPKETVTTEKLKMLPII